MPEKVRYTLHPRKPAGSSEGGRFAPGKAVKVMPVLAKSRTVVVPSPREASGREKACVTVKLPAQDHATPLKR
jgi:hypothetical protein